MDRTLRLLHGSRLDALAARMADELDATPLSDPLAPEIIVVPHPGMGRWLQQFLAQRWGIASCLELVLPGKFVWDMARAIEGALPEQSAYERDALEWRVYGALRDERGPASRSVTLRRYLADGDASKAFELAQRVADAFDQYLVYRPAWLERWEAGTAGVPHPHEPWQRELWRTIRSGIGEPHRAAVVRSAAARLASDTSASQRLPARVSVFGVSAMPAQHVEFIAALARRVDVRWYQLNPSTEWWGDVVTKRERARIAARLAAQGVSEEDAHLDAAHPLLAAWGKVGRDTLHALYAQPIEDEVLAVEHATIEDAPGATRDLFAPPMPSPRAAPRMLDWLVATLDTLDPQLPPPATIDDSIRVHACANRVREVEVLHDRLLELIERDPTIAPRDVVVMTPRIADYAPLVEAVFGGAPESRRIPITVADRPARDEHALLRAFGVLLALPQSRLTASEVVDLLAVDAIARRFELSGEAGEDVATWIDALRIRWGLDADDRERAGVGRWGDFAWRQGLDRLVLGYAMGSRGDGPVEGAAAISPYPHVEGRRAAIAGSLVRFVERLADWRARLSAPRIAAAWQKDLVSLAGEMFDARATDAAEASATRTIHAAIDAMADAVARGGESELALPHAVVRAAIEQRLAEPDRHQRFLSSGVTVCAMVPMRNVPFRVVCLLGLDDGEFPRREPEPSFHLMRAFPAPGDRTRQDDDRYLFLEAMLAARDVVHLSHVAQSARDGSERPPSSVVAELVDFIAGAYPVEQRPSVHEALEVVHAAAAFEPAAFAANAPLRSYETAWVGAAAAAAGPRVAPAPFARTTAVPALAGGPVEVALGDLVAFYRDPPKHHVRRVLELVLPDFSVAADDEPQVMEGLDRYGIDDALLRRLMTDADASDAVLIAMLRARALLRPGRAGERDANARLCCVRRVVAEFRARFGDATTRVVPVDRSTAAWRITGEIEVLGDAAVTLRAGGARGGDCIALALAAILGDCSVGWLLGIEDDAPCVRRLDPAALDAAWLDGVVAWYLGARDAFAPLLRQASWAYSKNAATNPAQAAANARKMIRPQRGGGDARPEEDDPHAALLLRGREDPFDAEFEVAAQALLVPLRSAIVEGGPA
ncbi:MAG TPA: exodeoxyribonuclease V subunit gamma [Candidatus Saccharimonadia bacterium]|nr:exodeoxyribonuclease V subunit gamma [Candidatus Saccharimonadia bacterium]